MNGTILTALAWAAQTVSPAAPPAAGDASGTTGQAASPGLFPPEMLFMLGAMGLLFYLLILKPQRTDQRKREQMMEEMGKGDQVVTAGGIHGTIEGIDKATNTVSVLVAPKIALRFNRSSIASVTSRKSKPKGEKDDKSEEATA